MAATHINIKPVAAWQVLSGRGELGLAVALALRQALVDVLAAGAAAVVVDMSGVTLLDCACVTVLVEAAQQAKRQGTDIRFVGAQGRVRRVLEITGAAVELGIDAPRTGVAGRVCGVAVETVEAVLAARAAVASDDPHRQVLRDLAVELCLPLADRLAGYYRHTGQPGDELTQVAAVGLLNAIDRYEPELGTGFLSFAFPTILGELRRHFRDHTWGVHIPCHLQELRLSTNEAADAMTQRLRRAPTVRELASHLATPVEEVSEAMVAAQGYLSASLSQPVVACASIELGDLVGAPDEDLDRVDHYESLGSLMAELPDPEQRVLAYRYFGNMTQTQIAGILGVSQMQVSRLQARALTRLREALLADGG
jgi:RNA polymerase sigma-B factor